MTIYAADLFCGAGGTSTGLVRAAERAGRKLHLLAVNHWDVAVETHSANHPSARHICASLDGMNPRSAIRKLDLLLASPECTHHSTARGGKPMNDQSRASAWHVVHWAEAMRPRAILVENVREFRTWGPLNAKGRPIKSRAGETYRAWIDALRSLGYRVEDRLLCAADYGDPTTRVRLFVVAVRGRGQIPWPSPTHTKGGTGDLFEARARWRAAREIIDWSIEGRSIFGRRKPLAEATLRRIEQGLLRFGGAAAEPFLLILRRNMGARSLDVPAPSVLAGGQHIGVVEPFVLSQQSGGAPRQVGLPIPTVAAKGAVSLVQPFLVPRYGERPGQTPRTHSIDDPAPTVPATCQHGLVEPFVLQVNHGENRDGKRGNGGRVRSIDQPVPTVTATSRGLAIAQPFMVPYYGTGGADSVEEPVRTLTAKDRLGLAEPDALHFDIRFRMLQPHELAAAQGFPGDYFFHGNREDVVRQIGNAVPVNLSTALCESLLRAVA